MAAEINMHAENCNNGRFIGEYKYMYINLGVVACICISCII